ncbi:PAS domain-containing protein [Devosia sp. MC532]|nr:PAS domain-containing protein [Devosia sp. MC532]
MLLDLTPDCIKALTPDGVVLTLNKAGRRALNVPDDSPFGMTWLSLLPEEVHPAATAALQVAITGQSTRFLGKSLQAGQEIFWDNLLLPLIDPAQGVISILCISRDVSEKVALETKLERALERERILAREMRHRIKNMFSVVSGLSAIAQAEARSQGDQAAASGIFQGKLDALSRASDAIFETDIAGGSDLVSFRSIIEAILKPYGSRCEIVSDDVQKIRRSDVTTYALILHEMATNSVKYGALSNSKGTVILSWSNRGSSLDLEWTETGGPAIDYQGRIGFGTQMVDRVVRSAQGAVQRSWLKCGLAAIVSLPAVSG